MKSSDALILVVSLVIAALLVVAFTCNKQSATVDAAKFADSFAHGVSAFHNAVDVAHTAGKISDADYQVILKDIVTADEAGLSLNTAISGYAAGTTTQAQVQAIVTTIENALTDGVAHITDPTTLTEVNTLVAAVNTTLTTLVSTLGGTQ